MQKTLALFLLVTSISSFAGNYFDVKITNPKIEEGSRSTFFISGTEQNAHMFCFSKGYDRMTSFTNTTYLAGINENPNVFSNYGVAWAIHPNGERNSSNNSIEENGKDAVLRTVNCRKYIQ